MSALGSRVMPLGRREVLTAVGMKYLFGNKFEKEQIWLRTPASIFLADPETTGQGTVLGVVEPGRRTCAHGQVVHSIDPAGGDLFQTVRTGGVSVLHGESPPRVLRPPGLLLLRPQPALPVSLLLQLLLASFAFLPRQLLALAHRVVLLLGRGRLRRRPPLTAPKLRLLAVDDAVHPPVPRHALDRNDLPVERPPDELDQFLLAEHPTASGVIEASEAVVHHPELWLMFFRGAHPDRGHRADPTRRSFVRGHPAHSDALVEVAVGACLDVVQGDRRQLCLPGHPLGAICRGRHHVRAPGAVLGRYFQRGEPPGCSDRARHLQLEHVVLPRFIRQFARRRPSRVVAEEPHAVLGDLRMKGPVALRAGELDPGAGLVDLCPVQLVPEVGKGGVEAAQVGVQRGERHESHLLAIRRTRGVSDRTADSRRH